MQLQLVRGLLQLLITLQLSDREAALQAMGPRSLVKVLRLRQHGRRHSAPAVMLLRRNLLRSAFSRMLRKKAQLR